MAEGPPSEGLAAAAASLPAWGHLPTDVEALRDACENALDGRPTEASPWLAQTLALTGVLPADALRAAAQARTETASWLLPALAIRYGADTGSGPDTAVQVLGTLSPGQAWAALVALGAPEDLGEPPTDLLEAAAYGTALAGSERPTEFPGAPGSRRHRMRGLVSHLVAGNNEPLSHALWALAPTQQPPWLQARIIATAAWLGSRRFSGDPVQDVLERRAGPTRLSAARSQGAFADDACKAASKGNLAGAILALDAAPERAVLPILARAARTPDLSWLSLASACAPQLASGLPSLLADPVHRDVALVVAAWTPSWEVLQALMTLPIPTDPDRRLLMYDALAAMGEPVAARHLMAIEKATGDTMSDHNLALIATLGV